jgi:hypothetical protein
MDEMDVEATARPLVEWTTDDLRRAYRFAVLAVHAAHAGAGPAGDVPAAEDEAALFAFELLRRGEL